MSASWNANELELDKIKAIADSDEDTPVLMVNINKYLDGEYPNGDSYKSYMKILPQILAEVAGKVLWQLPVLGQPVGSQAADEILGIWYPSHKSFLALRTAPSYEENFRLKNLCISKAVIHRCPADIIPKD